MKKGFSTFKANLVLVLWPFLLENELLITEAAMADFDAIYEDHSLDVVSPAAGPSTSFLEDSYGSPPAVLVPDPIVVRGAGNITV